MTRKLQSRLSEITRFKPNCSDASSRSTGILLPCIARRRRALAVEGLLSYTDPPEKSPALMQCRANQTGVFRMTFSTQYFYDITEQGRQQVDYPGPLPG
jgi:hypothetical protein